MNKPIGITFVLAETSNLKHSIFKIPCKGNHIGLSVLIIEDGQLLEDLDNEQS